MKNYVTPKLVMLLFGQGVLTADIVSTSLMVNEHEEIDGFSSGWLKG